MRDIPLECSLFVIDVAVSDDWQTSPCGGELSSQNTGPKVGPADNGAVELSLPPLAEGVVWSR